MEPVTQLCGLKGCTNGIIPGLFVEAEVFFSSVGWGNRSERKTVRVEVCHDHGVLLGALDAVA